MWKGSGGAKFASADVFGVEARDVMFGSPEPSGHLVGQRHGGFVVAFALGQRQRPLLGAIQRLPAFSGSVCGDQRRACAVDQQGAQVHIPPLGDAPKLARAAARILTRRQAQRTGKVPAGREGAKSPMPALSAVAVIRPTPLAAIRRWLRVSCLAISVNCFSMATMASWHRVI